MPSAGYLWEDERGIGSMPVAQKLENFNEDCVFVVGFSSAFPCVFWNMCPLLWVCVWGGGRNRVNL